MSRKVNLIVDGANGIYVPKVFAEWIKDHHQKWHISKEDLEVLLEEPETDVYWDTWEHVMSTAYFIDPVDPTLRWTLYQDADLWAVRSDMNEDEWELHF